MRRRQSRRRPMPRLWLMTDERIGEDLWTALERLPRGGGIVFRHYGLAKVERRLLFERVAAVARRRRLTLVLAGIDPGVRSWRTDGRHGSRRGGGIRTASVHSIPEMRRAERQRADLLFLGPAFPTRSHPGRRALGSVRFRILALHARLPVVALGGMSTHRAKQLRGATFGWAAIDAWTGAAKRPKRAGRLRTTSA